LAVLLAPNLAFGASGRARRRPGPHRIQATWPAFCGGDLLLVVNLLTRRPPTGALTAAMERLASPLVALRLPGIDAAMVGSIALRFHAIQGVGLRSPRRRPHSRRHGPSPGASRGGLAANALAAAC
jgi:hypothetical protein